VILDASGNPLKPYLVYSSALHGGLLLAGLLLLGRPGSSTTGQVYRIDFIGPSAGIINRDPDAAAVQAQQTKASARPPPLVQKDEFARKPRRPLPRPSILGAYQEPAPAPAQAEKPSSAEGGGGDASVSADMPNFPYPWYITQIRSSLWSQWSSRMAQGGGEALVMFSILRNGSVVDLRVESSSGDASFDYTALSAVKDCSPFPPLPRGFGEGFLKVHVHFKSL